MTQVTWRNKLSRLNKVMRYPIIPSARKHREVVDESALPDEAQALIRRVVKKTRLKRWEKCDVAVELVAHFQDAVDTGESIETTIDRFGDVKIAARLIRRGKLRCRAWPWRMWRRMKQSAGVLVLLYIGTWLVFFIDSPGPLVDYVAKMNAVAQAVPESDRAWPIYRQVILDYRLYENEPSGFDYLYVDESQSGSGKFEVAEPGDANWENAHAWLMSHQEMIAKIREGASKEGLGLSVGFDDDFQIEDELALFGEYEAAQRALIRSQRKSKPINDDDVPRLHAEILIGVLLPHLGRMRLLARFVDADALHAAHAGDGERFVADVAAMLGLARHSAETPVLICDFVRISIDAMAISRLCDGLSRFADRFSDGQLVEMADLLRGIDYPKGRIPEGEQWFIEDILQRMYGRTGRVTHEGMKMLMMLGPAPDNVDEPIAWFGGNARLIMSNGTLPIAAAVIAPRDEMMQKYERFMQLARESLGRTLRQIHEQAGVQDAQINAWRASPWHNARYFPVVLLAPVYNSASKAYARVEHLRDAVRIAIAAHLYRRETGEWPESVEALCPRYLLTPPRDESAPGDQPLRLRVMDQAEAGGGLDDGGPGGGGVVIYGLGFDGDDDGGRVPAGYDIYPRVPEGDGDWVLYPLPCEE